MAEVAELKEFVDEVDSDLSKIQREYSETVNNINVAFRQIDVIFSKHRQQRKLYLELRSQLNELKKEYGSNNEMKEIEDQLNKMDSVVTEIGRSKRRTGSYFVSMIMGAVSCRIWNEGDRFKFKSEYNRFKERWIFIFFLSPMIQIVFPSTFLSMWQLQSCAFLYYYTTLAIRENILALNGSKIESWWIYHHYVSMVIAILSLMINYEHTGEGVAYLNYFFLLQGVVMILQNDYQKRRHYARKAMAKKGRLDIRTSEVIDETPHSRYKMLVPALYLVYFLQLMVSIYFLFLSMSAQTNIGFTQMMISSMAWFVLSIGNTSTLSKVLQKKKRLQAAAKQIQQKSS